MTEAECERPSSGPREYGYAHAAAGCTTPYLRPIVSGYVEQLPPASVVLDAGCGNGALLGSFGGRGLRRIGLEISASGLDVARRAHPDVEFRATDLSSPISDDALFGQCDLVISTEVVEHIFLPRAFAGNCYRFLKPGGRFVISTPYHGYAKNLLLAATGKLDAHFTALWDFGHIKFWSRRTLGQLLNEAGFRVDAFHGAGRVPLLWKSMVLVASKPLAAQSPAPR